jgi:hypothetical protein
LQSNLPVTPVHDLAIKDGDLVVATHGRSFWIFDDITPLRQAANAGAAQIFAPRTTIRFRPFSGFSLPPAEGKNSRLIGPIHITYAGNKLLDAGENPPNGVLITYALNDDAPVQIDVLDGGGSAIVTLENLPTGSGAHRTLWDMRYPPPTPVEGATFWDESGAAGPLAPPGVYQVRMTLGGNVQTQTFELLVDPRVDVSPAALQEQFALLLQI